MNAEKEADARRGKVMVPKYQQSLVDRVTGAHMKVFSEFASS